VPLQVSPHLGALQRSGAGDALQGWVAAGFVCFDPALVLDRRRVDHFTVDRLYWGLGKNRGWNWG